MFSFTKLLTLITLAQALSASSNDTFPLHKRAVTVTVNLGTTYQTMDGFGFSEAFGHAANLHALSSSAQKTALDLLFSTTAGAGMTILRNRIGSGGSGDSIEPSSPGSPSATPKYSWDGSDGYQVWLSQQAQNYGVKTIYADAWSAPGFMKTNGQEVNGGYICGVSGESCSSGDWKQAYANFLVQYLKYYQAAGVTISHVGFLNEPEYTTTYSSMNSNGQQAADFIKVLSPTIKNAGLSTKITCCDSEGWNNQKTMTAALINAGVESQLGVITSHSYSSQPNGPISTKLNVWQTEYADLSGAFSTTWYANGGVGEGLHWAQTIYTCIVNSNCSGYLYWIGAETGAKNSALISLSGSTVTASKRLWAFAMWSRFVRPGAVRVGTSGSGTGLSFAAFKNTDGTVTVEVINAGGSAQTVNVAVNGLTATSVKAYITDNNNAVASLSASISGGQATANVPAYAMVAFVLSGSGGASSSSSSTTATSTSTTSTTTSTTATSTPTGTCSSLYGQCGGIGYTGATCCSSGTCKYSNDYYSQCL